MAHEKSKEGKDWSKLADEDLELELDPKAEAAKPEKAPVETVAVTGGGILEHPSYKELEDKLTQAEQRADKYWNEVLRAQAEAENIKRRSMLDVQNAHKFGIERLVADLLPIADSLEAGLSQAKEKAAPGLEHIIEGMELTLKLLHSLFAKFAIVPLNPIGEDFDPSLHEAMSMQVVADMAPNKVAQVLQKGYRLQGRLVRPALVIVTKAG